MVFLLQPLYDIALDRHHKTLRDAALANLTLLAVMGFHLAQSKYHSCVREEQFYGSVSDSIYLVLNKFLNLTVCVRTSPSTCYLLGWP